MEADKTTIGTCRLDYETEYPKLFKEHRKLMAENERLRNTIIEMCKQLFVKGGAEE